MKNIIFIVVILVVIGVIVLAQWEKQTVDPVEQPAAIDTTTPDSAPTTTEAVSATTTDSDVIVVTAPTSGATVGSPVEVLGQARGYWFFEGDAPVVVTNWDGLIIGEGYITAEGDWMTENFVPFTGTIAYTLPADSYSASGTVIFQRDNPSGLPENDAAYEVSVQLVPER